MIFLTFFHCVQWHSWNFCMSCNGWMDLVSVSSKILCKVYMPYVVTLLSQTPIFGFIARLVVMNTHQTMMHGTMRLEGSRTWQKFLADVGHRRRVSSKVAWRPGGFLPALQSTAGEPRQRRGNGEDFSLLEFTAGQGLHELRQSDLHTLELGFHCYLQIFSLLLPEWQHLAGERGELMCLAGAWRHQPPDSWPLAVCHLVTRLAAGGPRHSHVPGP